MVAPITSSACSNAFSGAQSRFDLGRSTPVNRHGSSQHCIELRRSSPRIPRSTVEVLVCPPASPSPVDRGAVALFGLGVAAPRPRATSMSRAVARCMARMSGSHHRVARPVAIHRSRGTADPTVAEDVLVASPERGDETTVFQSAAAIQALVMSMAGVGLHHASAGERPTLCREMTMGVGSLAAIAVRVGHEESRREIVCASSASRNPAVKDLHLPQHDSTDPRCSTPTPSMATPMRVAHAVTPSTANAITRNPSAARVQGVGATQSTAANRVQRTVICGV
jgi:hypothetical protein